QNCAAPFGVCGNACVDLSRDARNCGGCGTTCRADEACVDGSCRQAGGGSSSGNSTETQSARTCPPGQTFCDDSQECRNLSSDAGSCGACGVRCPSLVCRDGRCLSDEEADSGPCAPGETFCDLEDGYCADLQTNLLNCGQCGTTCSTGEACSDGA